jgi:hypothetical protein
MKKKKLLITLINNDQHRIELGGSSLSIGQPLNSPENLGAAVNVARSGFCIDPKAPEPEIVPPSQIKSVKLILE